LLNFSRNFETFGRTTIMAVGLERVGSVVVLVIAFRRVELRQWEDLGDNRVASTEPDADELIDANPVAIGPVGPRSWQKMADLYCDPESAPCRLGVVGS
jgi:hypothetical protein